MEAIAQAAQEIVNQSPPSLASSQYSIRLVIWIFAAFQFLYMLTSTGRVRTSDEYTTLYTAESIVLWGSTAIPQAIQLHNFYGRFDLQGQPRPAYPPGQAVLCTPWYALGYYVLSRLPGVPEADRDFVVWFSTCLSSATFSALTAALFLLLLTRIGFPLKPSLLATVLLGLATPVFAYSGWLFSEPLSAAMFMSVALLVSARREAPVALSAASVAGLILGLTVWVRPTNVLAIAIFAIAVLARDGRSGLRAAALMCGASAIGVLGLLSRNAGLFGSLFEFGYPDPSRTTGIDYSFGNPVVGLYGFLISPGKSVVLFAPPVILAAVGLPQLWRIERGLATVAGLLPAVSLLFFAANAHWEGGYCVGPRYLIPSVALLCVGLAPALAGATRGLKRLGFLLLGLGVAVQCVTLATSFLEDQAPSRGHYYDAGSHYRLSYSLASQIQILLKYSKAGQPHRLGLGWDRWFVFLHVAGVSGATLTVIALLMLGGLIVSLIGIARTVRASNY